MVLHRTGSSSSSPSSLPSPIRASHGVPVGMTPRKLLVVLLQLGGPDSLPAVEPFLYNLFRDPDIIDFPFSKLAREPLARLLARSRARKVRSHYAAIGGRSPLVEWTQRQAEALEERLRPHFLARVRVAMRYWHPLTEEVVAEIHPAGEEEILLLPLYPQYSRVTTGSSLNEWRRQYARAGHRQPVQVIQEFYRHPGYLEAVVEKIQITLARFPARADVTLVFSAHSIPASVVEAGDPYRAQIESTVERLCERGGWPNRVRLCYQSKVGPGRWLEPMLHPTLRELAGAGRRHVLVVPIAFVSEHIETLYEINREAREFAQGLGIEQFEMMPALNDSPTFIATLADLVRDAVREPAHAGRAKHS